MAKSKTTSQRQAEEHRAVKPLKSASQPERQEVVVAPATADDGKLAMYVADGMSKFKSRLAQDLARMVNADRAASDLAQSFIVMRQIKDSVDEAAKLIGEACDRMSKEVVPSAFEREKLKTFTTENGYRIGISQRYFASIIPDMKAEAFAWLRDHKLGDLIVETVNSGTLSSAAKHMMEESGSELPETLFRAHFQPTTSLTKVSK